MAFLIITRSSLIVILCIFLIMIGIIQGKMKKPNRIKIIEMQEEKKISSYKNTIIEVTSEDISNKYDFNKGFLGVKDKFLTFFNDEEIFHEGWKVITRVEALTIELNNIDSIAVEQENIINIYVTSQELNGNIYKFKAIHSNEIDGFISFLNSERDGK